MGVIASGVGYNYFMENADISSEIPVLKIGVYPIPDVLVNEFLKDKDEVLIVEDGYPFIETRLQIYVKNPDLKVKGKLSGDLPSTGELNPDLVRKALGREPLESSLQEAGELAIPRPPRLCDGCAHIQVFDILDSLREDMDDLVVFSDIGCYTLGALRQPASIDSCVCMGASVGMAKGAANGGLKNSIGIIGDSTFMHSGIHTLLKAAGDNSPFTIVILDNSTTGMTGGQDLPLPGEAIEKLVVALGVPEEHVKIIDPRRKKFEENREIVRDEINYRGFSVIIARRECIVQLKAKKKKKK
jgi:indolepyruvate ferredoxin oxidoreductase alpha subunit